MNTETFNVNGILKQIKESSNKKNLGMVLVHNGIVRGTSKDGKNVTSMKVDYDEKKLEKLKSKILEYEFVEAIEIYINKGKLNVGDDIMFVVLAGNNRKRLLPLFENIIEEIKQNIVKEIEQ